MNTVIPVLLIGLGGFLIGGVISLWNKSRLPAVLLALFSAGCILGGVLWLMGL
ncbi:MAG: hypothetical protein ABWZ98_10620 [Nakamurella sp.]